MLPSTHACPLPSRPVEQRAVYQRISVRHILYIEAHAIHLLVSTHDLKAVASIHIIQRLDITQKHRHTLSHGNGALESAGRIDIARAKAPVIQKEPLSVPVVACASCKQIAPLMARLVGAVDDRRVVQRVSAVGLLIGIDVVLFQVSRRTHDVEELGFQRDARRLQLIQLIVARISVVQQPLLPGNQLGLQLGPGIRTSFEIFEMKRRRQRKPLHQKVLQQRSEMQNTHNMLPRHTHIRLSCFVQPECLLPYGRGFFGLALCRVLVQLCIVSLQCLFMLLSKVFEILQVCLDKQLEGLNKAVLEVGYLGIQSSLASFLSFPPSIMRHANIYTIPIWSWKLNPSAKHLKSSWWQRQWSWGLDWSCEYGWQERIHLDHQRAFTYHGIIDADRNNFFTQCVGFQVEFCGAIQD